MIIRHYKESEELWNLENEAWLYLKIDVEVVKGWSCKAIDILLGWLNIAAAYRDHNIRSRNLTIKARVKILSLNLGGIIIDLIAFNACREWTIEIS